MSDKIYWNSNIDNNLYFFDIILDNFKNYLPDKYDYLIKNKETLKLELINISNFFKLLTNKYTSNDDIYLFLTNIYDKNNIQIISNKNAKLIIKCLFYKNQKGGTTYKLGKYYYKLRKYIIQYGGVEEDYNMNILKDLEKFKSEIKNTKKSKNILNYNKGFNIFQLPLLIKPLLSEEYQQQININDILLIGFSVLPTIGWIFEIFLILRCLIEKRYVLAILLTINCYQYLFYKLISFGFLGMNFGRLIKLFYLAPYANNNFNYENIKLKLKDFLQNINMSLGKEYLISN